MKFLIVDDDPDILKITKKLLEMQSLEVDTCESALDAIDKLSSLSFDILITDATMPAYSGFDLIRTTKKNPMLNYLTVAMLTGRSEKSDIEQALDLGVQDYIVKPIDPVVFLDKISRLMKIHQKKAKAKPLKSELMLEIKLKAKVVRLTDVGMTIECSNFLEKGTEISLDHPELVEAGIVQNRFKVIYCSPPSSTSHAVAELILLDADPKSQKILNELAKNSGFKKVG